MCTCILHTHKDNNKRITRPACCQLARGEALDRGAKVSALAKIGSLARATAVSRCQRYPAHELFLRSRSLSAYSVQALGGAIYVT